MTLVCECGQDTWFVFSLEGERLVQIRGDVAKDEGEEIRATAITCVDCGEKMDADPADFKLG